MTEREWRKSLVDLEQRLVDRLNCVRALRRGDSTVKSFTRCGHWVKRYWVSEHEVYVINRRKR